MVRGIVAGVEVVDLGVDVGVGCDVLGKSCY